MSSSTPVQGMAAQQIPPAGHGQPSLWRDLFGNRRFIILTLILALSALGLNASVQFLQLHFKKESVPMRHRFDQTMPIELGNWVQVAREETLDADTEAALATKEFLLCSYVNYKAVGQAPQALRKRFADMKTIAEQRRELDKIKLETPTAVLALGLTYYTGKADTVAHIPERCYAGGGFDPVNPQDLFWDLGRDLHVRHVRFQSGALPSLNVAYFFHCNGQYMADSIQVRMALQSLFARYGYYAKIEITCDTIDQARSEQAMRQFLELALPRIEEALPDWRQWQSR